VTKFSVLYDFRALKVHFRTGVDFEKTTDEGVNPTTGWFYSRPITMSGISDVDMADVAAGFNQAVENFYVRGSNWQMKNLREFTICFSPYLPLQGSSFLPTPQCISGKRAVVNIKNDDNYCFLYSILAGIRIDLKTHPNRASQYQRRLNELNYDGLEFPLKFQDVAKFENMNPDVSVNVFLYTISKPKDGLYPLYVTKNRDRAHHVNLLLLEDDDKYHYTLITDLSRLVFGRTKSNDKCWVCDYCLHPFTREDTYVRHLDDCKIHKPQTVVYCNDEVYFKNTKRAMRVPFIIYTDFESFLKPVDDDETRVRDIHEPSGFCIYRVSQWAEYDKDPYVYSCEPDQGMSVMDKFFECLMKERDEIDEIMKKNVKMIDLNQEERRKMQSLGPALIVRRSLIAETTK